ncbi:hypothetical protein ACFVIM_02060 [Streptomyces sp. NPDC057638]|uniref:hypothetical protein n=1 Tax=Streptomyces sp. NPDC057638 TaxID=3346190 RepID=UPI00368524DA
MRGLMGERGRGAWAASTTAMAGLAAIGVLISGCSTGGAGVRDAGSAQAENRGEATQSAPRVNGSQPMRKVNAARLIQGDPKVSAQLKAELKPCAGKEYPMDTSYGNLTGSTVPDVVVNVVTCGDVVGLGTFVYRWAGSEYRNVFALEEPAIHATIDRGDLVLTKQLFERDAPVSSPTGEEITTYEWSAGKFSRTHWVRNEYNSPLNEDDLLPIDEPPVENES